VEEVEEVTEVTNVAEGLEEAEKSTEVIDEEAEEKKDGKSQVFFKDLTRKSFKDMNNEEKIYFFMHRPHYIPNVKCRVIAEKDIYVGFITNYQDGYVSINSPQTFETFHVKFEEIVSIQIMGI
ncbi:CotO family spore coat protein, partial [Bacillus pseudomycoides]